MNDNFYNKITELVKMIDINKINFKLIKTNSIKLIKVWQQIDKLWKHIDLNDIKYETYDINNNEYMKIISLIKKNFLFTNKHIKKITINTTYIHHLNLKNIHFYWLGNSNEKNLDDVNYLMALDMLKISICLNQFKYKNDNVSRYIIWIPINKKRNFKYNKISELNLKKTGDDFEAFVASGVTFSIDPKITIITRYEEVEKLLIHELIHNYNIDGSEFHNGLVDVLNKYYITKNKNKNNKINYHYEYSIYESYTELLSTYFYLIFENIKSNIKIDLNKLIGQITIELIYSYNVIANLINLNGYLTYDDFRTKIFFDGNICKYEYYYIKALMYNNFIIDFGNNLDDFICIYENVIEMIKQNQNMDDDLLEEIYNNSIKCTNFKYQIH